MQDMDSVNGLWLLLQTWGCALPRALGFLSILPFFGREMMPGLLRSSVAAALCLPMVPALHSVVQPLDMQSLVFIGQIIKEVIVGLILGFPVALTFWLVEGVGTLLDNQAGSSVASVINPMSGNDSAIFGGLLNQLFMGFFVIMGGLAWIAGTLYTSYRLWPIDAWYPHFYLVGLSGWLSQFTRYFQLIVTLAAPILIAVFLIDLGFGVVGRFAPKMQIFVVALPVKNMVAVALILLFIMGLFGHFEQFIAYLDQAVPEAIQAIQ